MMKNKLIIAFSFLIACFMLLYAAPTMATVLPLPMVQQLQTNWCWAAGTQAIENYYDKTASQCDMANYLLTRQYGYLPENCCLYAALSLPIDPPHRCNQGNFLLYSEPVGNVQEIMSTKYSTPSTALDGLHGGVGALSQSEVNTEIQTGRPFMMRWDWSHYSGAHVLVGFGLTGDLMDWMDPWPWNSQHNVSSYAWVNHATDGTIYAGTSYDHTWTQTVRPSITPSTIPQPPTVDIKANNKDGVVGVSHSTPTNITVSVDPGGYTNILADWWVVSYINGIYYYYYYDTGTHSWKWTTQARPAWQKGLQYLPPTSVFYAAIPAGISATFYSMVDLSMDGYFDYPYYSDYVTVTSY